jgi:hypothetical protein
MSGAELFGIVIPVLVALFLLYALLLGERL